MLVGMAFFVSGAIGARIFYKFPMGFFVVTFWEDVVIFSAVAISGLTLATYAAFKLRRTK